MNETAVSVSTDVKEPYTVAEIEDCIEGEFLYLKSNKKIRAVRSTCSGNQNEN